MQKELIEWYEINKRDLPWRQSQDAYKIWISEMMLQQTTVEAVIPYYLSFIKKYPDIYSLAKSSLEEVYKAWEGLGYYRRARYIYENAKTIVTKYKGKFPDNYDDIISLKGIGPYSAGAILSIAYLQPIGAVDGNVLRIMARYYNIKDNIALTSTVKQITVLVNDLIKGYNPSAFNQGLMDLGAMVCKVKSPDCLHCPINKNCQAFHTHQQEVLPIRIKKVKSQEIHYITGVITYQDQFLLIKNPPGLLENLYGFIQYESDDPYQFMTLFKNDYQKEIKIKSYVKTIKHVFSHRIWIMDVYHYELDSQINHLYTKKEIDKLPISSAHQKVYQAYLKEN